MSGVRVLVGTAKGAFILTADSKREKWEVLGPFFAGRTVYHMRTYSNNRTRLHLGQTSGRFQKPNRRKEWMTTSATHWLVSGLCPVIQAVFDHKQLHSARCEEPQAAAIANTVSQF